jgi:polar amino acid transport system substrate-binding protein
MRRLLLAIGAVALAGAVTAAFAVAAPWGGARADRAHRAEAATKLPPLPADVAQRKRWKIGVKCDFPPFGYINRQNKNAGYDVDVARRFAELAFGKRTRLSLTCVTTPSRIPALQRKDVDIIISTLTWTSAREDIIDYSYPYYNATGRLLVPNNSSIRRLTDLRGKRIATTRGSIYDRYIGNCFGTATKVLSDSPVAALENVRSGRADVFMFDDTFLLGIAANDANLKLTQNKFLNVPYGIGIRKNEPDMKRWVDAAIRQMKRKDEFWKILRMNSPRQFWKFFLTNVPRPKTKEAYPRGRTPEAECPS